MALNFDHQRNRISSSSNNITINTNGGLTLPVGSTGDRPTPAQGMIRYNTTDNRFEAYNGTVWIGLAGVIDADKNTYIIAETTPGANNNELDFYTNAIQRMQIGSNGNLLFGNSLNKFTVNYATGATTIAGQTEVTSNNSSTSKTSGALVVTGGVGIGENLYVGGNINVTGDVAINGNLTFGDSDSDGITINADINSSLVPNANGTNDIGQSGKAWRNIYISKTLTFEGATTENKIVVPANLATSLSIKDSSNNDLAVFDTTTNAIRTTFNGIVDINSIRALKLPVGTTSDRPTAEQGMIRYNTSYNLFEAYNGTSWSGLGGVTDLDKNTYIVAETSPGANNNDLDFYTAGTQRLQIDETGAFKFGGASLDKFTIAYSTGNTAIKGTLSVDGATTLTSAKVSNLVDHGIVIVGVDGALENDANFRFNGSTFDIGAAGFEKFSVIVSSGNTDINGTLDVAGQTTLATVNILDITSGRVPYATTSGQLISSSNLTFDGSILGVTASVHVTGDLDVDNININGNTIISTNTNGNINLTPNGSGEVIASSLTVSDLTSTRLVFTGTSGALVDSVNLTYNGSVLDLSASVNIIGDLDVDNLNINANSIISTNTDGDINLTPNGLGKVIASSLKVSDLSINRIVIAGSNGLLIDNSNLTFDGTTLNATAAVNITGDLDVDNININGNTIISTNTDGNINLTPNGTGEVIASSLTVSDLTNNRIVIAGTSGALTNSSNLTYDGTTLAIGSDRFTVASSTGNTETKGSLTVGGNLTVNGTTTTLNSTTVTVDDPIFTLGGDVPPIADDNKDRGIEFRYFNGSAKTGFFGYDDSTGYFTFIPDATNTSEVFSGTPGTLDVASITGSAAKWTTSKTVTFATGDVTGNFSIDGSGDVSDVALTIAANSVALGTDTTGNYVATVAAGTPGVETSSSGLTISAAAGESTAATIAHADTSTLTGAQGSAGIAAITVDGFGHVTAVTTATYLTTESTDFKTVTVTDTDSGYTWATTGSAVAETTGDTLTIVDGGGIDIDVDAASDAIRIQHSDTSSAANLSATSRTYVDSLTFDTFGHVTGYTTASETVTDTNVLYDISAITTSGGASLRLHGTDSTSDDVKFASGTNVTVAYTDASTITFSSTDTNTTYSQSAVTTTGGALLRLSGSDSTTDDVKFASGTAVTVAYTDANTITIDHTDTSTLTGAQGTAGIASFTVDGYGHITAVTTATYLTSQSTDFKTVTVTDTDSGYTWSTTGSAVGSSTGDTLTIVDGGGIDIDADAASKAIRIQHSDTSSAANLTATSRTYVDSLTFDTYGHVTAYTTSAETVTDTNTTYDISSVTTSGGALLRLTAGGSGSGTDDVKFASGTNVTVAYTDANTITISSSYTDTNTTYGQSAVTTTGGALLRLTGSDSTTDDVKFASGNAITVAYTDADTITINHTDTSTVSNLSATSRTYVSALTFDTYGHVTAYSTASETVTDTNTTYDISAVTTTGGALLRLTAGGSGSGTDDVKFAGAGITSIAYTDASTITITSTEADTLDSVTSRGATTTNSITVGDIAVNGGDITTTQSTFGLIDQNATTVNAFGATTTLNLGYTGTAANTTNISIGATASSTTKTINLGTGGASGSTTNINIGSASGGTTTVNNNLTVTGNLTVNGTTTTVNSTTVTIDDPIFTIGGDTAPSVDDNKDRGIEFRWHNGSSAKVGFFGYDDSAARFTFIPDATNSSEVFSGTAGDVAFGGVYASTVTGGNIQIGVTSANTVDTSTGNLTINSAGGTTTIDDAVAVTGTLDVTGVINANSTAGATNTTSGALVVDGGVGIAENLYVGNTINTAKGVKFTGIPLASAPAYTEGLIWYNSDAKTLELYGSSSDFSIFMGEREWVRGRNTYGSTIYKGQPVYATGVHIPGNPIHGHHPTLAPADASDVNKIQVLGLAAHDIPDGQHGYVIVRGYLDNLNTSALMTGMRFHLGFATPGELVMTAPEYPNYPVDLGICLTEDATTGTVYVQIANHTQERLRVTGTARVDGDLTVGGNLNLLGSGSSLTLTNLSVDNNFIYLNSGDTIGEANTNFTGSGLNDAAFVGHYEGTTTKHFYVKIDSVGGGTGGIDTFAWSLDNFVTTIASGIDLSTTPVALQSNISVVFQATVGHTLNDKWDGTTAPVNLDIALIGNRNTGTSGVGYTHLGFFFDVSDEKWKLFSRYDPEPTLNIDTSDTSFTLGNLVANAFEGPLIGNATTSSYWANSRTVTFATGDVTGSFTIDGSNDVSNVALTIAANSVALGTDTTGNYVATVAAGTPGSETSSSGLTISAVSGEGTAATIAHADTSTLTGAQGSAGIAAITVDGFGHVTAVTTATYLTAETDTLDSVAARNASTSRAITITNATGSTNSTSGALIVTGGVGVGENLSVNGSIKVDSAYNLSSATLTTTSITPTAIASFSKTTFGGGKVVIQAYDSVTGNRTISEMLIVHDGTTASATEYGIVNTSTAIATYDVDINSGNIRIIATAASSNSTQYKVVQTLILA
jgi:hypothetical protein